MCVFMGVCVYVRVSVYIHFTQVRIGIVYCLLFNFIAISSSSLLSMPILVNTIMDCTFHNLIQDITLKIF